MLSVFLSGDYAGFSSYFFTYSIGFYFWGESNPGSFSASVMTLICMSDVCACNDRQSINMSFTLNMYLFIENVNIN